MWSTLPTPILLDVWARRHGRLSPHRFLWTFCFSGMLVCFEMLSVLFRYDSLIPAWRLHS